nr:ribonuclease H-like domain-containing protein [Tanacetum cinerariifolium]
MPPKPYLVFHDAPTASKIVPNVVYVEPSSTKPSKHLSQTLRPDAPIIEDWTSNLEDESKIVSVPKQKEPSFVQTFKHVKTPRASQMVQNPVWNHETRVNHQTSPRMTHPHSNRHVVPTLILTRSRLVPLNVAKPVTIVVPQPTVKSPKPVKHVVNNAHSPIRRPINHKPALKNSNFHQKVTNVKAKKVNAVQGTKGKGCGNQNIQVSHGLGLQKILSFLFDVQDFKEINEGYVAFGRNLKSGKITGKGKIKTGILDFDDVYFVKELKFNLFTVSQMCDKKNSVLFTDTECVVLSSDFKMLNENHVLLRVPRENNMHNVDLKNVVPSGDFTFLFAKATLDES